MMCHQRSLQLFAQWSVRAYCVPSVYKPGQVLYQQQHDSLRSVNSPPPNPHTWLLVRPQTSTINHNGPRLTVQDASNGHMMMECRRGFSSGTTYGQKAKPKPSREIMESKEKTYGQLTTGEKVVRAGKDATYTIIVIIGFTVTGMMAYVIGRELLSGQSPSGVYSRATKLCRKNDDLVVAIGEPIKARGEMNRRGRSRHVSHMKYNRDGVEYMRMHFYIDAPHGSGTVHLEAKKNESGKYEFRYIFAELDDLSRRTIVIEDNR